MNRDPLTSAKIIKSPTQEHAPTYSVPFFFLWKSTMCSTKTSVNINTYPSTRHLIMLSQASAKKKKNVFYEYATGTCDIKCFYCDHASKKNSGAYHSELFHKAIPINIPTYFSHPLLHPLADTKEDSKWHLRFQRETKRPNHMNPNDKPKKLSQTLQNKPFQITLTQKKYNNYTSFRFSLSRYINPSPFLRAKSLFHWQELWNNELLAASINLH